MREEYTIANAWENIPQKVNIVNGLVIDGYWDKNRRGFYVVIYDLQTDQLVKYLDTSIYPHLKVKGEVSPAIADRVKFVELYNAISNSHQQISLVKTLEDNIYYNYKIGKGAELVNTAVNPDLVYFHETQLTPGTLVESDRDGIRPQLGSINSTPEKDSIRNKLLGEPPEIIELAELNMPLLEMEIPEIHRVAFDIEVKAPRGVFPVPDEAAFPVHAIGLYSNLNQSIIWMLGYPPTKQHRQEVIEEIGYIPETRIFLREQELLQDFFNEITKYPVILSYNGDNFDMPYLRNRASKLGFQSPIHQGFTKGFYYRKQWHFEGSIHLDLFRFFANNSVRLYAFGAKYSRLRLDDVAEALLGVKKIEHDLWFDEMSRSQMIAYTIRDVELTLQLTTFSNSLAWKVMIMIMRVGKMTVTQVNRASISNWILNWIAFEHARKGWMLPTKQQLKQKGVFDSAAGIEGKGYQGAIVFEPEPGVYWDVTVADYASLYPSVIKKFRLSYETIRCNHVKCKNKPSNRVPELSHWICDQQGIMSALVGYVRDIRVKHYKSVAKYGDTEEEKELAATIQAALKVFINASYGVFGNQRFALFCPPVAESTTAYSRHALIKAKDLAEEMGYEVVYGDTDSIFVHKLTEQDFIQLKAWSVVQLGIELGIDYKFRYLVLSDRKKNYFGIKMDKGTITKGLQVKKSNTSLFIKELYQEILDRLTEVEHPDELQDALKFMKNKIRDTRELLKRGDIPISKLSKMVTLNKSFNSYETKTIAVQVAIQVMTEENQDEYQQGTQFLIIPSISKEFVVETTKFDYFPKGTVMTCNYQLADNIDKVDINWQKFEDELRNAFTPIFEAFGISWESEIYHTTTLDQFLR